MKFYSLLPLAAAARAGDQIPLRLANPKPAMGKVQDELKKAEIIPTVIDDFVPSMALEAKWSDEVFASLGNTLKVDTVQKEPTITMQFDESLVNLNKPGVTYAITITDPDAPSRDDPKWSEFCHFIATGVTSSSSSDTQLSLDGYSLDDVVPYKPPGPPPKTGKHRYVFLLFTPTNGTTEALNLTKPDDRKHWGTGKERHGVRDWALKNGLEPVAANFIYAQNEKQ
ncbi:PEBP-like protein [Xylariaceae sp. FL0016]|nr:PEBP-like protein [Xylariaceae sp. FL0016]